MSKYLPKIGYLLLSLALAFHVFAVFISPAAMPPVSPLLLDGYRLALPYNKALFLNHGYHFFAPDPGASTLISWSIPREGDAPLVGRFPDVTIRPRLLYHRYFMLAENIWGFDDETQADIHKAYARHFSSLHNAEAMTLRLSNQRRSERLIFPRRPPPVHPLHGISEDSGNVTRSQTAAPKRRVVLCSPLIHGRSQCLASILV